MTDLSAIDYKENVRRVVKRRLKELGIKVPKTKGRAEKPHSSNETTSVVFGVPLEKLPAKNISCDFYCWIPRFLVKATQCLENHLGSEGLFRKSGSSVRQKQLKKTIEDGGNISDAQPHDVASLLKQFFRELPEPLLTNQLHDCFLKCLLLDRKNEQIMAILLLCIMLPTYHLSTLQYFLKFIARVASKSEESKMGSSNLAIVLTPNLMNSNSKKENSSSCEKLLKDQTSVIQILLENAQEIGMISDDIIHEAKTIDNTIEGGMSSGDELDGDKPGLRSRNRTTSSSISGFVSGFGSKVTRFRNSSRVHSQHRRSKSVKAEFSRQKRNVEVDIKAKDDSAMFTKHMVSAELTGVLREGKRKPLEREVDKELTPAGKRKMTVKEQAHCQVISSPFSVTGSTQMFMTPKRPIQRVKPLSENVSVSKGNKDSSHETQHVKVVDARHYESPEALRPGTITLEFTKLLEQTPTGDKYVFDSPLSATLSSASNAKTKRAQAKRQGRNRANRRNSSGATRCFSSSPRSRNNKASKKNGPNGAHTSSEDNHGSMGTLSVGSKTGEQCNLLDENNPWYKAMNKDTPRKNTPPVPLLARKKEFRTIFSENVF